MGRCRQGHRDCRRRIVQNKGVLPLLVLLVGLSLWGLSLYFFDDGVAKDDYWQVVDHCYLCDMCYMSKCPYVPPHEWNVDFPHLMLRAKAKRFKDQGATLQERVLSSTDRVGQLAGIPVATPAGGVVQIGELVDIETGEILRRREDGQQASVGTGL